MSFIRFLKRMGVGFIGLIMIIIGFMGSMFGGFSDNPYERMLSGPIGFIIVILGGIIVLYSRYISKEDRERLR